MSCGPLLPFLFIEIFSTHRSYTLSHCVRNKCCTSWWSRMTITPLCVCVLSVWSAAGVQNDGPGVPPTPGDGAWKPAAVFGEKRACKSFRLTLDRVLSVTEHSNISLFSLRGGGGICWQVDTIKDLIVASFDWCTFMQVTPSSSSWALLALLQTWSGAKCFTDFRWTT